MMENQSFIRSCERAAEYPNNLLHPATYKHCLDLYAKRLQQATSTLFSTAASDVLLEVFKYGEMRGSFQPLHLRSITQVKEEFPVSSTTLRRDSRCTFLFWQAKHSRERLQLTSEMALYLLSYLQVKPFVLDFLFLFGSKLYPRDVHFSSFRNAITISKSSRETCLRDLGRSGTYIETCYNLQGVEEDSASEAWPWSIRHGVVWHRLDLVSDTTSWLFLKGNSLLKQRIKDFLELSPVQSRSDRSLPLSLDVHGLICDWSVEGWRWYLNFLEDKLNDLTRTSVSVEQKSLPPPSRRSQTLKPSADKPSHRNSSFGREVRQWVRSWRFGTGRLQRPSQLPVYQQPLTTFEQQMEPPELPPDFGAIPKPVPQYTGFQAFTIADLQQAQYIEEKVNEAVLVIKRNISIITKMKHYYSNPSLDDHEPQESLAEVKEKVNIFQDRLQGLNDELLMHEGRAESLLKLIADRKSLLFGILEFRNLEANHDVAAKSHLSALNMEDLTRKMSTLTRKTKQETVSMRIITVVALFFLPGTFVSTLMSTDMVKYADGQMSISSGRVSLGAVELFLVLTLPLMLLTFGVSYTFYRCVNRDSESCDHQQEG